jgi:hypothetical protein
MASPDIQSTPRSWKKSKEGEKEHGATDSARPEHHQSSPQFAPAGKKELVNS